MSLSYGQRNLSYGQKNLDESLVILFLHVTIQDAIFFLDTIWHLSVNGIYEKIEKRHQEVKRMYSIGRLSVQGQLYNRSCTVSLHLLLEKPLSTYFSISSSICVLLDVGGQV